MLVLPFDVRHGIIDRYVLAEHCVPLVPVEMTDGTFVPVLHIRADRLLIGTCDGSVEKGVGCMVDIMHEIL